MCPAPAPLHLERYIGSCLISTGLPHHQQNHQNYHKKELQHHTSRYRRFPISTTQQCHLQNTNEYLTTSYSRTPAWTTAAGLPLISMSPGSPRHQVIKDKQLTQDIERSPLSRLAIHTQGAPLIQSVRQQQQQQQQQQQHHHHYQQQRLMLNNNKHNKQTKKEKEQKDLIAATTTTTATSTTISDESSGNSENSLPRIIKPRKRRKKDRKPQLQQQQQTNGIISTAQQQPNGIISATTEQQQETAIVTLKPYTPLCQDFTTQNKDNKIIVKINNDKVNDIKNNYKLIEESLNLQQHCQCRYCDPINMTWDVEQRCYSPYLTPPNFNKSNNDNNSNNVIEELDFDDNTKYSSLEVSSEIITSPNGHRDIEIKFFTSIQPASKFLQNNNSTTVGGAASVVSRSFSSITPPWPN